MVAAAAARTPISKSSTLDECAAIICSHQHRGDGNFSWRHQTQMNEWLNAANRIRRGVACPWSVRRGKRPNIKWNRIMIVALGQTRILFRFCAVSLPRSDARTYTRTHKSTCHTLAVRPSELCWSRFCHFALVQFRRCGRFHARTSLNSILPPPPPAFGRLGHKQLRKRSLRDNIPPSHNSFEENEIAAAKLSQFQADAKHVVDWDMPRTHAHAVCLVMYVCVCVCKRIIEIYYSRVPFRG